VPVTISTTARGQGSARFPIAATDCAFAKSRQNTLANCLRDDYALDFHSSELSKFFIKLLIYIVNLAHPTGFEPVTSAFGGQRSDPAELRVLGLRSIAKSSRIRNLSRLTLWQPHQQDPLHSLT
jgi:hypothetical protein